MNPSMQIKIANPFPSPFLSFFFPSFFRFSFARCQCFYRPKYPRPAARRFGDRSRRRFSFFAAALTAVPPNQQVIPRCIYYARTVRVA
ncbi:hypothetical protein M431DRAFT_510629 [Trichoderma harzianum CBS 226.95]|uniref:Uncharacterized protein n=1 Tax=Trichoderma harzianum CBS 226.95 TaxID=983964 RepID=A0A2T4A5W4_TRIHA|nr:hypothetical protein M431DRAFT_510629 [Trichoderma harzianum CBS 226.95]PTB52462.1 hypothetical protein M431DRAFT_510629 [Trichoderma harzianum CBS 226.95]